LIGREGRQSERASEGREMRLVAASQTTISDRHAYKSVTLSRDHPPTLLPLEMTSADL
jgi:hypothetical protein